MLRPSLHLLAIATLLAGVSAALADTLSIEGLYGNETGCWVAAGGDYTGDDKFLLRADGYEAHESGCEFVAVHASRSGAELAIALCEGEGSLWTQSVIVSQPDPESPSRLIFFDNGELWREVSPCS